MKVLQPLIVVSILVSFAAVAGHADADPPLRGAPIAKAKAKTKIVVNAVTLKVGESKTFEAVLVTDGTTTKQPVVGKNVRFRHSTPVPGVAPQIGQPVPTDNAGHASLSSAIVPLAEGTYKLFAEFDGDDTTEGAKDEAVLTVQKSPTAFTVGQATNGNVVPITLRRTTDNAGVHSHAAKLTIVRRASSSITLPPNDLGTWQVPLTPAEAASWTLKLEFEGDQMYAPTTLEKVVQHP